MSPNEEPAPSAASQAGGESPELTPQRQIDAVRLRFEAAWKAGRPLALPGLVAGAPETGRAVLLRELLLLDLAHRRRRGDIPTPEEYQRQFPEQATLIDAVFHAVIPALARTVDEAPPAVGEPAASRVLLEVLEGPHCGTRQEFDRHATLVVGRARTAQLCLAEDPYFSRHHFLLEFHPPSCYLRDLGSRNGTLVNGHRVKEAFLRDGDVISGGKTRMRFAVLSRAPVADAVPRCLACGKPLPLATNASGRDAADASPWCPSCRPQDRAHPQLVPGYEIVCELGRGGMGVVYLARHLASGRPTALKLIIPECAVSDRAVRLFLREVSILRRLDHPRIVRFHEVGTANGQFFLAMEYVDAVDLKELLARQSLQKAAKTLCGVFCQALEALGYAHAQAFVHRDVKPSNLLVSRGGRKLRVKLADFGLAKNYQTAGFSGMTRRGDVRGSLPFIAPEQILDCRNAQPAVDIYGAGASLYYLLAGTAPHGFSAGRDPYAVILEEDIVPLSRRCPALAPGLVVVVHRALAREPQERFALAAEMRQALLPYAQGLTPEP